MGILFTGALMFISGCSLTGLFLLTSKETQNKILKKLNEL